MNTVKALAIAAACLALSQAFPVRADDVGQHPAVFSPRQLPAVNPSTFVVGHPASPQVRGGHANQDHPAVQVRRQGDAIDPNTYLVQPPASAHWALTSGDVAAVRTASAH